MANTKEEILQLMTTLDTATLNKLQDYSRMLIIPEEDLLINVTMKQMFEKAHQLADIHFPEWTDRGESDFGRFLVELMCLFSEKDFWYINAFANESLLAKMTVYSNAFSKAVSLGYDPTLCKSPQLTANITFAAGPGVTYGVGDLAVAIEGSGLSFTNATAFTLPLNASPSTVPLTLMEGLYNRESSRFNGHSVFINRPLVDIESVSVTIADVVWTRVRNFGRSNSSSTHFVILPESDGRFTIFFGDGIYGVKPQIGTNVDALYRVTKADKGNAPIGTLTISKSNVNRAAQSGTMATTASGGVAPETLDSIKNNTTLYFSSKKAAINPSVTESILNTFAEVHKSKVTVTGNNVFFYFVPKIGAVATTQQLTDVHNKLKDLLMLGYNSLAQPTVSKVVSPVVMDIYYLQGYDKNITESLVRQLVIDYTNPKVINGYGNGFLLSELSLLIRSKVPGVQNVVFITVAGLPAANITIPSVQVLQPLLSNQLTTTMYVV